MKKISILSGSLLFTLLVSCGPGKNAALKYHEGIMSIVNKLTLSQNGFMMQIDGHNMDSLRIAQQQFAQHSKASLDEINKVEAFDEKVDYRNTAMEYIKTVNSLATHESKQMVEIMAKDSAQLTEADLVKVAQLSAKFDTDYEKAFNMLEVAQMAFAKEWKFGIEKK